MDLLEQIMARAKSNPQRIVLPEGTEPRTLEAANIILKEKAAQLILIGNADEINKMAAEKGYSYISEATIVDPSNDPRMPKYANLLYELRKSKGMTMEEAEKLAQIRDIPFDKLAQITSDNFYNLFRKASDKGRYAFK